GKLWVPTSSPVSPITPFSAPVIDVNFTLETASSVQFPVYASTGNLPAGTSWTYSIDGTQYGSTTVAASPLDVTGGSHQIGASTVVLDNSTRFLPSSIHTRDFSGAGVYANSTSFPTSVQVLGTTYAVI